MSSSPRQRFHLVAVVLALAAVGILLGLGSHGHHDECHDYCWVCHSFFGMVGLPAVAFTLLVVWTSRNSLHDSILALHDLDANLHTAPRAPPC